MITTSRNCIRDMTGIISFLFFGSVFFFHHQLLLHLVANDVYFLTTSWSSCGFMVSDQIRRASVLCVLEQKIADSLQTAPRHLCLFEEERRGFKSLTCDAQRGVSRCTLMYCTILDYTMRNYRLGSGTLLFVTYCLSPMYVVEE